jgi:hypothetical protein
MAVKEANGAVEAAPRKVDRFEEVSVPESPTPQESEEPGYAPALETSKRRMPENLRKYLLRLQGGKFYLPAAYRIVWFRDEFPYWTIETELVEGGQEAGFATVKATVKNEDGRVISTGHKTETKQDFPAGWVEKCETGACARALSLAGFGTQFSPELDDEEYRPADSPQPLGGYGEAAVRRSGGEAVRRTAAQSPNRPNTEAEVWEGPGQCPRCHAPEGKRHGRQCLAA